VHFPQREAPADPWREPNHGSACRCEPRRAYVHGHLRRWRACNQLGWRRYGRQHLPRHVRGGLRRWRRPLGRRRNGAAATVPGCANFSVCETSSRTCTPTSSRGSLTLPRSFLSLCLKCPAWLRRRATSSARRLTRNVQLAALHLPAAATGQGGAGAWLHRYRM